MSYETETKQETGCDIIVTLTRKLSEYIEDTVIKQYQKELANG